MNHHILGSKNSVDVNLITAALLLILGCVTSFLFFLFEGSIETGSDAEIVFIQIQKYMFFVYIAISFVLLLGLKDQHIKTLISAKIVIAMLVLGSFAYFIVHLVYPLYLTRYSYCIAESSLLFLVFLPNGSYYLDFPACGVILEGLLSKFTMTVTCMQPAFWVYFIGPIAFYPGKMKFIEKLKRFLFLYFMTHVVNILILFVEMTTSITSKTPWVIIHEAVLVNVISVSVKAISFLILAVKLFPEAKNWLIG